MAKKNEEIIYAEDIMTPEEFEEFKESFCGGTFKFEILSDEEVEQLRKENRI